MSLEKELNFFQENKKEWLKYYAGKYLLVKDTNLVGVFDDPQKAFNDGVEKFGLDSFLVKKVSKVETIEKIPALTLGLMNACP